MTLVLDAASPRSAIWGQPDTNAISTRLGVAVPALSTAPLLDTGRI
jgi:hypothetical protein